MKKGFQALKKVLSWIMVIAMLISFMPPYVIHAADTKTIYLNAGGSSLWDQANAWFDAWVWGSAQADAWYTFADSDFDGVYEIEIPSDATGMKILRKDPASTEHNWNSWNATGDLTISGNCYTVTGWGSSDGTWSDYTPVAPVFTVAGASGLCGTEWNPADASNDMTKNASGVYEKVFTDVAAGTYEYKVVLNHSWDKSWGNGSSNASVTVAEAGSTVTVTFDPATQTVAATVVKPLAEYTVTFTGTNVTSDGAETVTEGEDYTATLTAPEGYELPETVTVTVGGTAIDTYTYADGLLTIPADSITGDIVITAEGVEEETDPATMTVYFRNDWLWSEVRIYYWGSNTGTNPQWPGVAMTKCDNDGTYDIYTATIPADVTGILFNGPENGNASNTQQTPDITDAQDGNAYYIYWDGENKVAEFDYTPSGGEGGEGDDTTQNTYEVTFHFADTLGWGTVNLYTWLDSGELTGGWPGTAVKTDASGYYTHTVKYEAQSNAGLNFIFNNGSAQTVDLIVPASDFVDNKAEKWVVLTTQTNGKYNAVIVNSPDAIVTSPVIDGSSVTFNFGDKNATSVCVAGSFNGWSATANPLTKGEDGVWSVTVNDLAAGDYQYKFVVDGENWILDPMNGNVVTEADGNQNSAFYILSSQDEEDDNKVTINVHYTRTDGDYDGWNLWVWGSNMGGHQVDFESTDADGAVVATIVLEDARAHQSISFKERLSVEGNEWKDQGSSDRTIDLSTVVSGTIDYYIPSGNCVYGDDIIRKNKISSVELDYDNNAIIVTSVQAIADPESALKLVKGEEEIAVTVTAVGSKYTLALPEGTNLDLAELYQYKVDHYGDLYAIAIDAAYASDRFAAEFEYTGNDLGATYYTSETVFRVWAPTAEAVNVNLYISGTAGTDDLIQSVPMSKDVNGTWIVTVSGDQNGVYYTYEVNVNGETVEACDPYARTTGVNGQRAMVVDLDSTDPTYWDNDGNPNPVTSQTDAIIYELHVRDFSIDDSSGVKEAWRGKYLAFTQTGTTTSGGHKTGIDYLADLGITHLHLLPVYDFGSVDETTSNSFNWGYDPQNYNVPEGSYSTDPYNGEVRVNEFKQMVKALHDADISVVMDVVYNHVYDAEEFCFNQIVPGYFSRPDSNRSGCGNDTASEREMVRKYIVDSVLYWHEEYHIDGFRFDLVGLLDVETIKQIVEEVHDCCPGVIFYGEGWDMDSTNKESGTEMAKQGNASKTPGFAYFSDSMRNGIAGSNGSSTGFASGAGNGSSMVSEWMANPWWTKNPQQVVQYASCHDNYTLADKLILSTGASGLTSDIVKMNNLSAVFYMTAQGVPFIHAGEEILREKLYENGKREENSYNKGDEVNHIEWSNLDSNDTVDYAANNAYYKGLIEFRKAHPALRYSTAAKVADNVTSRDASGNLLTFRIDGNGSAAEQDDIFVIFNAHTTAQTVDLPEGEWTICINDTKAGTESLGTASGSVSVPGISAMVLTKTDEGEDEDEPLQSSEEKTIYFSNNKHWDKVYAYAWTDGGSTVLLGQWPGTEMTYVETNDYGEDIYCITLPASATGVEGVIFSDGNGQQTVDIAPGVDGTGYYCTDTNAEGKYEVGTYTYRAPALGSATDYFLHGWINNADYFSDGYKFDGDGKIKVTFTEDSYVYVVNGDATETYMTDGYQGAVTTAEMYDVAKHQLTADKWDKLLIPGGVEVVITMVKNTDDATVTLSYEVQIESVQDTSGIQEGVTLHCWNWSFKEIEENMALIADMGFTAIQTSPVQPLKEATTDPTDTVGGVWWVYYQPVDFVITTDDGNALGTKAELESMIETAHEYGVKVIVDVVANHLGNQTGNDLAEAIPEYLRKDAYWHDITKDISSWEDREDMTQNCLDGLPDLNTANKEIQGFVLEFLKECVDIGVDGFRFDMAKSIETPMDDASFASDFWPTVVGGAEAYASGEYGKDLYIYGEVLDDAKIAIGAYSQYMAVTDNGWGNHLRTMIAEKNATLVSGYYKAAPASALVIWAESHDTFASNASSGVLEADINKTWALVAARADAMGLYLARPESVDQLLGVASLTGWDNAEVEAVNEFHNAFVGQTEAIGNENGISYVERGTTGVVLVNVSGSNEVSVTANAMEDGTYVDQITGNTFTVADGKITGEIGDTGIAVVYNPVNPDYTVTVADTADGTVTADKETAKAGETVTVTVTAAEGKEIDQVTAVDAAGQSVAVTDNGDGTYSFIQPAAAVTVSVTFKDKTSDVPVQNQITVSDTVSGTVEVSNKNPATGAVVTVTPVPDEGVMVEKVIVTDASGNEVTVTANEDGTYSFTQPEGDVTVQVIFKPDYKIIAGNGSSAEHGSDEILTFKANGAFDKFTGVEVDGNSIDAKHYDAKAGSTVITLKASYLKTLSAGEHTIIMLYTDGETEVGTFSLEEAEDETTAPSTGEDDETTVPSTGEDDETTAPSTGEDDETTAPSTGEDDETTAPSTGEDGETTAPTGDDSMILQWTSVMAVSLIGMAVLLLEQKRRNKAK